jgi:plastocyanin
MKRLVVTLSVAMMVVVACSSSPVSGSTDVHMGTFTFVPSSVTISKGSSINLINDDDVIHLVSNGSDVNPTTIFTPEPGAPTVSNLRFDSSGQSKIIGPFNTSGTFHFFDALKSGMDLTVIVQ